MRPSHYNSRYKDHLTPRQRQVADLLTRGRTNNEIAAELGLGWETVKSHVSEVLAKLHVDTREEAAASWRYERSVPAAISRRLRAVQGVLSGRWAAGTAVISSLAAAGVLLAVALSSVTSNGDRQELPIPRQPSVTLRARVDQGCCVPHQIGVVRENAYVLGPSNGSSSWQSHIVQFTPSAPASIPVPIRTWPLAVVGWEDQLWLAGPDATSLARYAGSAPRRGAQGSFGPPREIPGEPGDGSWIMAVEAGSLDVLIEFTAPARIGQLVVSGADLWAASTVDKSVLHFRTDGTLLHSTQLESIGEIALDGPNLWVSFPSEDRLVRISGATGNVDLAVDLPACGCGNHIAVTGDAVWVTLFARSSVVRIDSADPTKVQEIPMTAVPQHIGAGSDGSLWVLLETIDESVLVGLDPSTGAVTTTTGLGRLEGADALTIGSRAVWVADHGGAVIRVER